MKKELLLLAIGIVAIATIIGCCVLWASILDKRSIISCSPIPEGFSETELAGIWAAGNPDHSDTLIIKADGTYKQIVHAEFVERLPLDYESEWQSWHLEYSEDNIGYLHLDGFRFCGMNRAIPCEERVGGGYDFCRDERIKMENEGILLVLTSRAKESPGTKVPRHDIHLAYPLGSENSWAYHRQEP